MANYPYYSSETDPGIRKGILDAEIELHKANKKIYAEFPYRISLFNSFKYRKSIKKFLLTTIPRIETLTEIERLKKLELSSNYSSIFENINSSIKFSIIILGLVKIFHIPREWKQKHMVIYMPHIPPVEILYRCGWFFAAVLLYKLSYVPTELSMCLYYPSLLCDLQIGEQFELGYWASKFSKTLTS